MELQLRCRGEKKWGGGGSNSRLCYLWRSQLLWISFFVMATVTDTESRYLSCSIIFCPLWGWRCSPPSHMRVSFRLLTPTPLPGTTAHRRERHMWRHARLSCEINHVPCNHFLTLSMRCLFKPLIAFLIFIITFSFFAGRDALASKMRFRTKTRCD